VPLALGRDAFDIAEGAGVQEIAHEEGYRERLRFLKRLARDVRGGAGRWFAKVSSATNSMHT
jgi:hypothetical protein